MGRSSADKKEQRRAEKFQPKKRLELKLWKNKKREETKPDMQVDQEQTTEEEERMRYAKCPSQKHWYCPNCGDSHVGSHDWQKKINVWQGGEMYVCADCAHFVF